VSLIVYGIPITMQGTSVPCNYRHCAQVAWTRPRGTRNEFERGVWSSECGTWNEKGILSQRRKGLSVLGLWQTGHQGQRRSPWLKSRRWGWRVCV